MLRVMADSAVESLDSSPALAQHHTRHNGSDLQHLSERASYLWMHEMQHAFVDA